MTHAKYKAKVRNIPYIVESVTLKKGPPRKLGNALRREFREISASFE